METTYDPKTIESHWTHVWETNSYAKTKKNGQSYCIMLPPPNVTGSLHMGHGFQQTLMDALIRKQRMEGKNVLWQAGTDHAGIATQIVVEALLARQGETRHKLGREKFIEKVWEWRDQSGSTITRQIHRLGASIDWSRARFSMDEPMCRATNEAFVRLYDNGLIYRGSRLVNWDPHLKTALSDLEVANESKQGNLWYIRYPLINQKDCIIIATTRPETMLADVAVAVHPDDERYKKLIGQTIQLPLVNREIPIIADEAVEPEFGTGCVKITPAHDFNDYEIGKRHHLTPINIFTLDAHLNENAPKTYQGLERFQARKKILKDLEQLELIEKVEPHQLTIPYGDRSGAILEPMLTDQWFIKAKPLAKEAIEVVKKGDIEFIPSNWAKTYLQWLENIQDWCISRQLWWGHRIPVWYDEKKNTYVGLDEKDVRQRYKLDEKIELHQDEDVLDTWFTASIYPFATLGWPTHTQELELFYPTDVLVTGFDIIFFWVARMVMMSLKLTKHIPFRKVYITGLIRDSQGKKMSKSKGNIIDPIDLIDGIDLESLIKKRIAGLMQPQMEKQIINATKKEFPNGIDSYGTDALRFTFCALATTGRDINFDMGRIAGYRNFCNKIWNAARYVFMNTEKQNLSTANLEYSLADRWIQSKLQTAIKNVNEAFARYRFDLLAQVLYEFVWNEYCDWYLELAKCVLNNPQSTSAQLQGTRRSLLEILEEILRLLHPVMPFITEEIWQKAAPMIDRKNETIMLAPFPKANPDLINEDAEAEIYWLKQIVTGIRNIRGEMNVSPSKSISILLSKGDASDKKRLEKYFNELQFLAKIEKYTWLKPAAPLPASANIIVNSLEIHIPLADFIDKEAEIARLDKEIAKLEREKEKSSKKLSNPNYVEKAPKEVVTKERSHLNQTEETLKKLQAHYRRIEML